jgi:hypothetical protein
MAKCGDHLAILSRVGMFIYAANYPISMKPGPSSDWPELIIAVLRDVPKLSGALCPRYPARLFDGGDDRSVALALSVCRRCPAQPRCAEWLARQPEGTVRGVIAGHLIE